MASDGLQRALDRLRLVLGPELPDEHLLKEFIGSRDEIAFAILVRRHGPMVLGIARRVLGNLHDSEDVLQATFLVLAQKARLVARREALASWLYKVAYRISLRARAGNCRRRKIETQARTMPHPQSSPAAQEWEALLDEELTRLPSKYRLPIIICDLQGRSRKEAEHQLKLAAGTLSSRLSRARRLLADRLTRRGVIVAGGALATPVANATAALTPTLAAAVARKAALVAAGQTTAIPASVSFLVQAGVKAMFISRLKVTFAVTAVLVAVMAAGSLVYSGGNKGQPGQDKAQQESAALRPQADRNAKAEGPVPPNATSGAKVQSSQVDEAFDALTGKSTDQKLQRELTQSNKDFRTLLREKRGAAKSAFEYECKLVAIGKKNMDLDILNSSKRLLDVELELAGTPKERTAALTRHWLSCQAMENDADRDVKTGRLHPIILSQATYFRIEAEIEYLKEKGRMGK